MMELKTRQAVNSSKNAVLSMMGENGHEQAVFCNDPSSGLKAIIAIHNTTLGPALGGTRMWPYPSEQEALTDVLRLSRGMTYKAAISDLNLGGGKAVIIGNSRTDKSEALFRSYGRFIESLNGKYITAEDVGTSIQDIEHISLETKHVTGRPERLGGSGDPSPFTAYGVFLGMKACAKELWGNDSLKDRKVAVQGVGNVGANLVRHLCGEGASVFISDIYEDRLKTISGSYAVKIAGTEEILDLDVDIYAPCALGATVNSESLERLKCAIIAGAANNQLADEKIHGRMVLEKGILYAPDFMINAGGLINVGMELEGYDRQKVQTATEKIYDRTLQVIRKARKENITTTGAAMQLAEERLSKGLKY